MDYDNQDNHEWQILPQMLSNRSHATGMTRRENEPTVYTTHVWTNSEAVDQVCDESTLSR